ncbi:MAG: hypothetical protein AAGC55_23975, partial [Myxococcota bacterium]
LGDGSSVDRTSPVQVTRDANGGSFGDVTDVCTGYTTTCARKSDGSVWCIGANHLGQLGTPSAPPTGSSRPVEVALGEEIIQGGLTCAMDHVCAVTRSGQVWCWGGNEHGQVGNASTYGIAAPNPVPTRVVGLPEPVHAVSADAQHTCAITKDDAVYCWGKDDKDRLFPGTSSSVPQLVQVP